VLDITVSKIATNPAVNIAVPDSVTSSASPVMVTVDKLAPGVFYLRGGTHHSVVIDQADHVVVVEGPLDEARSSAVIAKVKEIIPNKPLRYLINTHAHFDHSGGLRTWVDEGATIVTHAANRPYCEEAWKAPHMPKPDRLEQSKKRANFETFTDTHTLTDGKRTIEIYPIAGSGHNDAFAMVYLPAEGILVEADAYTPAAANAPPPAVPNPFTVNLNENITKQKLNVKQIAALHGPRVTTMGDLKAAITPRTNLTN
jgi:glyoxylase-like metal-dependent hydrolase (beta-lactamase superfamily II)